MSENKPIKIPSPKNEFLNCPFYNGSCRKEQCALWGENSNKQCAFKEIAYQLGNIANNLMK